VGKGSAYDLYLSRELQHAQIERAVSSPAVVQTFVESTADVAAGVKQQLEADAARLPGLRLPTQPVHFSGAAPNRAERAPALGEHTEALLSQWLGRGAEAIAALRASGALGTTGAAPSSPAH
ncbi:hypothetical protein ABXL43_35930, partial [Burkholderia sola]